MFQSLTSYFYGSSTDNNDDQNKVNQQTTADAQLVESVRLDKNDCEQEPRLVTKPCDEHDDEDEAEVSDWLLVDKEDSPAQTDSEDEIPFVEIKNAPVVPFRRGRNARIQNDGMSHVSLLPSSMDESWFVTPPPCFTSVGPISMEMSPFENLLIEHPSMSVYHSMRRSQSNIEVSEDDVIVIASQSMMLGHQRRQQHQQQQLTRRPNGQSNGQQSQQQQQLMQQQRNAVHPAAERSPTHTVRVRGESGRRSNTIKVLLSGNTPKNNHCKPTTAAKNALERSNKVREVNSKGGRQKRSDMNHSKVLSRANNNRKC